MDILGILADKLEFVRRFYKTASGPFVDVKAKIEAAEEPFNFEGPPREEPPFLREWVDAVESLNILGQLCLCLVQRSFKEFLVGFVKNTGREPPREGQNWFATYRSFYLREYDIDWRGAPVDISFLEELTLARNSILHSGTGHDIYRLAHAQSRDYYARFPQGLFTSEIDQSLWSGMGQNQPARIEVTEEKLELAIRSVDEFCSYLDRVFRERAWRAL
jgi:hypothetical protein